MKNWGLRDWINFSIIISLIQAMIWGTSYMFAKGPSALGYVSFAGTLISIILAVLAIGYTYGESVKQKNSSDTVVNQIGTLNKVIENIKIETSQLEKISEINKELTHLSEIFNDGIHKTHERFDSLNQSVNKVLNENFNAKQKKEVPNTIDKNILLELLLSAKNALLENSLLMIYLLDKTKNDDFLTNMTKRCSEYERKLIELCPEQANIDYVLHILVGGTGTVMTQFIGVELIDIIKDGENKIFSISTLLKTEIEESIIASEVSVYQIQAKLRGLILDDVKNKRFLNL